MNKFRYICESCGHEEQEEFNICPTCNEKEIAGLNREIANLKSELFESALQNEMAEAAALALKNSLGVACCAANRMISEVTDLKLHIDTLHALVKTKDLHVAALIIDDWEAAK